MSLINFKISPQLTWSKKILYQFNGCRNIYNNQCKNLCSSSNSIDSRQYKTPSTIETSIKKKQSIGTNTNQMYKNKQKRILRLHDLSDIALSFENNALRKGRTGYFLLKMEIN